MVARPGLLAIVEVKARSGAGFGTPAEAVTPAKTARLRRLAGRFLADHPDRAGVAVRFDVAEVRILPGGEPAVEVIEDAL